MKVLKATDENNYIKIIDSSNNIVGICKESCIDDTETLTYEEITIDEKTKIINEKKLKTQTIPKVSLVI
jgi:hypothetical protein